MKINLSILLFFVTMLFVYANNIETWNTIDATKKVTDDFKIGVSEEVRIGVDQVQTAKKLDEFHTALHLDFIRIDHMSLGIQDDYVLLRDKSDTRYRRDNRPGINISLYDTFYGFKILNRSRFVMRDLENERPYFRYRNLSKAYTPVLIHSKYADDIKLFVAYEWYFDEGSKDRKISKNGKFGQFWTDFGISFKIYKNTSIDVFYRLIEIKSNDAWNPGHAICSCINLNF